MTFNYARTAATVLRLLVRFGKSTTLTKTVGDYDPATASAGATPTVHNVIACVFPVEESRIDGSLILRGDMTAYVSAVGVPEPQASDVLAWEGKNLTVIDAKNLGPAGVMVLYELTVRA